MDYETIKELSEYLECNTYDVRVELCRKFNFKYNNIEKVRLIVPSNVKEKPQYNWVVSDEYAENAYLIELKDLFW